MANDLNTAKIQVETLKELETTGLQIVFEKIEMMTSDRHNLTKFLHTKYRNIKRCSHFKYLREIIYSNSFDKKSLRQRATRIETAFHLYKSTYQSNRYAAECLALAHSGEIENILMKFFRKNEGPRQYFNGEYRLKPNVDSTLYF